MSIRFFLDIVAAMQMLLTGQGRSAWAVIRARREFRRIRPLYSMKRKENLDKTVTTMIPERQLYSLLWQYYVCRRRQYSRL